MGLSLGVLLVGGEMVLRLAGFRGLTSGRSDLRVEPPDAHLYQPDGVLGYRLAPSQKLTITVGGRPSFAVTTNELGRRWSGPEVHPDRRPQVWIFGDSFTFGWGVNDEESYPARLQADLPDYQVVNFGVGGYGTLQSFLAFQQELKSERRPAVVILGHLGFHESRNVMSPERNRSLGYSWRDWGEANQPYLALEAGGRVRMRYSGSYRPYVPLARTSALANFLDQQIVHVLERRARLSDGRREITGRLIRDFIGTGSERGLIVGVADLGFTDGDLSGLVEGSGGRFIPVRVRYDSPSMSIPGDGHPTPRAHIEIARQLVRWISTLDHRLMQQGQGRP